MQRFILFFFETVILKNYVNVLSIISTLSPSASCCWRHCWRLGFGALLSKSASSASCCCRCFVVVGSGVPYCGCARWLLRLVIVIVFVVSFIVGSVSLLFLSSDSHCRCRRCWVSYLRRRLIVVVFVGLLSSASASAVASCCCCRRRRRRGVLLKY